MVSIKLHTFGISKDKSELYESFRLASGGSKISWTKNVCVNKEALSDKDLLEDIQHYLKSMPNTVKDCHTDKHLSKVCDGIMQAALGDDWEHCFRWTVLCSPKDWKCVPHLRKTGQIHILIPNSTIQTQGDIGAIVRFRSEFEEGQHNHFLVNGTGVILDQNILEWSIDPKLETTSLSDWCLTVFDRTLSQQDQANCWIKQLDPPSSPDDSYTLMNFDVKGGITKSTSPQDLVDNVFCMKVSPTLKMSSGNLLPELDELLNQGGGSFSHDLAGKTNKVVLRAKLSSSTCTSKYTLPYRPAADNENEEVEPIVVSESINKHLDAIYQELKKVLLLRFATFRKVRRSFDDVYDVTFFRQSDVLLPPHCDEPYGDGPGSIIAVLHIGGAPGTVFFAHGKEQRCFHLHTRVGTLYVFTGDPRYFWTHGILSHVGISKGTQRAILVWRFGKCSPEMNAKFYDFWEKDYDGKLPKPPVDDDLESTKVYSCPILSNAAILDQYT